MRVLVVSSYSAAGKRRRQALPTGALAFAVSVFSLETLCTVHILWWLRFAAYILGVSCIVCGKFRFLILMNVYSVWAIHIYEHVLEPDVVRLESPSPDHVQQAKSADRANFPTTTRAMGDLVNNSVLLVSFLPL